MKKGCSFYDGQPFSFINHVYYLIISVPVYIALPLSRTLKI